MLEDQSCGLPWSEYRRGRLGEGRVGGREGGREGWREGGREGGREGEREGWREGLREEEKLHDRKTTCR